VAPVGGPTSTVTVTPAAAPPPPEPEPEVDASLAPRDRLYAHLMPVWNDEAS